MGIERVSVPSVVVDAPDWPALRAELHIDERVTPDVQAEAEAAALRPFGGRIDLTDVPFFTIDPAGSMDLDQATFLERTATGYRVQYAIADVAHFVTPGGPMDARAHRQGQTMYGPDIDVPLHPDVLSQGAASLLPDQDRPAVVWTLDLDSRGELTGTRVQRAIVRSRRKLSYDDTPTNDEQMTLLQAIGERRMAIAAARGAVDLPSAEQVVGNGPTLEYRLSTPTEQWNAQISLLTGIAAGRLMIDAKVGMLRTLPTASERSIESLKQSAVALDIPWPEGASYGEIISSLDIDLPHAPAFLTVATRLLRGATYVTFDGALPTELNHAGVGAPYAHCTAPLRRLGDRFVSEICLAVSSGSRPPEWVLEALPALPSELSSASQRASALNRAVIDAAEAYVMTPYVGQTLPAVVVEVPKQNKSVSVQLTDPAVRSKATGTAPLGAAVQVRCVSADVATRTLNLELG